MRIYRASDISVSFRVYEFVMRISFFFHDID